MTIQYSGIQSYISIYEPFLGPKLVISSKLLNIYSFLPSRPMLFTSKVLFKLALRLESLITILMWALKRPLISLYKPYMNSPMHFQIARASKSLTTKLTNIRSLPAMHSKVHTE